MKRSELIQIIKEEVKREVMIEGIIDSLISLFLSPKIKKDVKKLKGSPEWIELQQKLKLIKGDMEMFNDRLGVYLKKCEEDAKWWKSRGMKPPVDCSSMTQYKRKI
jgi:hypothetical protein